MHKSEEMLRKTQFVVEATCNEMLWLQEKHRQYTWVQHNPGCLITVGEVKIDGEAFPINIACQWFSINEVMVLFWEAVSVTTPSRLRDGFSKDA